MTEVKNKTLTLKFSDLPSLGARIDDGNFVGVITTKDGAHVAVILLPEQAKNVTWDMAVKWAEANGAQLPTRPMAALIFINTQDRPQSGWHWISEEDGASYAWHCGFGHGNQDGYSKSFEGSAVAVRLIQITA
jgi:hypothetical protein